jgi:oxaloacetate decarboxylase gamma subunit
MTIVEMLEQSSVLTLLGMGIVFSFLVILVVCVSVMGRIARTLGAGKDAGVSPAPGGSSGSNGAAKATAVAAAITAAVNEYQKNNS